MLLHHDLRHAACRWPDKVALMNAEQAITYLSLERQANNLAGFFKTRGLERGDRVLLYMGNRTESAVAVYGALFAGGCFCIVNPSVKTERLQYLLAHSGAKFVIADASRLATVIQASSTLDAPPQIISADPFVGMPDLQNIVSQTPEISWKQPVDLDLASIIYTSGSTGDPKGVTLTHRNMVSAVTSITSYLELAEHDVLLNALPLSFDYGLYQLLMSVRTGSTLVLRSGLGYPYELVETIKAHQISVLPLVPTMMAVLLQLDNLASAPLQSVRIVTNTAAAMPPSYIPRLRTVFPNARIFSMYGLTECKRVSYVPPDMLDTKPDSVGIPMPNTEVWVVDDHNTPLPAGATGELVVRGASVMQGYWHDPQETARRLRPGKYPWEKVLYTGDLFRMDEDGYLYFVARKDDLIKSRGERISPKEIENVLYDMPEILVVRVSGVPHEILGQAIRAEIVLKEGVTLTTSQVKAYCQQRLEDFKLPHVVEFVSKLPISTSGKVAPATSDHQRRSRVESQ